MPSRRLQFILVCGISCGMLGCKSPTSWLPGSSGASTAPLVQYNGLSGSSSTVAASTSTQPSSAWDSITSLLGTAPKLDADIDIRAAQMAEQAGNFADAETKYKRALKSEPKNVRAIAGLAKLYDQQGNTQQAIATYKSALKLHPQNPELYNHMGLCYSHRREFGPAQQMLQKACEIEPGKALYRMNLAFVLVESGRPADGYQQLIAVQPEAVARYNLACMLDDRGQRDQAAEQLRLALAKDPALTPARELLTQLEGVPQQTQQDLQMVNATVPSVRGNRPMQMDPRDLQPPEINYGPAASPRGKQTQQRQQDPAPQQQYPAQRTSYDDEVESDQVEPAPTTVHISDEE